MKTNMTFFALVVGLGVATTAMSQDVKKEEKAADKDKVTIRVRMSEEKDGKVETFERTYTYNGLSEEEREKKVKTIMDSLRNDSKAAANRRLSVEIEEGSSVARDKERWGDREHITVIPKDGRKRDVQIYRYEQPSDRRERNGDRKSERTYEFKFDDEAFADRMQRVEKRIEPQMRKLERNMEEWSRDFEPKFKEFWHGDVNISGAGKPASIRGLEAYPNNPEKNELNIRFYAPAKGDVTISVTDTKGKQIAKKEVKDFTGDYVGQLDLGKNVKGTYFISVVQNEDGTVKRVVVE